MEHAKLHLDRGLLIRSQGETAADAPQALQDMAEASASAKLMRQRCSAALAGREHSGSSAPSSLTKESPGGHTGDQGRGGEARRALLEEERRTLRELCSHHAAERLCKVVEVLRKKEEDLDFQAQLLSAQVQAGQSSGYSKTNFAYGSTPYQTWRAITRAPAVAEALVTCALLRAGAGACRLHAPLDAAAHVCGPREGAGGEAVAADGWGGGEGEGAVVVWGSSLGWLVFYSALTYGVRSRGVELLEDLCTISVETARELGVEGVSFRCADMLDDSLDDAKVLLLASQCWDAGELGAG